MESNELDNPYDDTSCFTLFKTDEDGYGFYPTASPELKGSFSYSYPTIESADKAANKTIMPQHHRDKAKQKGIKNDTRCIGCQRPRRYDKPVVANSGPLVKPLPRVANTIDIRASPSGKPAS